VSGGGGERDKHHSHDPRHRSWTAATSQQGRWARGPSVEGKGQFTHTKNSSLIRRSGRWQMTRVCWAKSIPTGPTERRHGPTPAQAA